MMSSCESVRYRGNWILIVPSMMYFVAKPHLGTANSTSIWLSMKTPIQRIIVLLLASGTHGKYAHSRLVAIVGNILDNREAWATVGTVDEGIMIAPV